VITIYLKLVYIVVPQEVDLI